MPAAAEIKDRRIKAKVTLQGVLFPKNHNPGEFAIARFNVVELIEGTLPDECLPQSDSLYVGDTGICAKGNMPTLKKDVEYIFQGNLVIDKKYGPRYDVEQLRLDYDLNSIADQRKFFSAFLTEKQVEALMAATDQPMKWLEDHDIEKLKTIKGVGDCVAERMIRKYEESKDYGRAYVELDGLGLTTAAIEKMVKRYGSVDVMVEKIKQNPYILIKEVHGYGWAKADELAQRQGLKPDSKERVIAYANYYLDTEAEDNGNSWIVVDTLLQEVMTMCRPVTKENLFAWIKEIMGGDEAFKKFSAMTHAERYKHRDEIPALYYNNKTRHVGSFSIRLMEYDIAENLKRLRNAPSFFHCTETELQQAIMEAEAEQGFEYDAEQTAAIHQIIDSNVSIITGLGGTGKTAMLNAATKLFKKLGLRIEQCALSGRASSKMSETTKVHGKTIHRLLNYLPDEERFMYGVDNPVPADVFILDETSMVGGELFLSLIEAIPTGAKFIMVGDHHQLEAIGLANVFKDCLSSGGYIPASVLVKIHRQAARSGIITQSIRASTGEKMINDDFIGEEIRGELQDFKIISSTDPHLTHYNIIKEYRRLRANGVSANDIQVIVPQRLRGNISCRALNDAIQQLANPGTHPGDMTVSYVENGTHYDVTYKIGDRIIVMKNNYHAKKPGATSRKDEVHIFNGNVGYIKDITSSRMIVHLTEQGDVQIDRADWKDIGLAYAITCHKKQGDQVPYAIIGLDTTAYAMFSKEWVYTAITRASKFCAFVTQPSAINRAVKISRVKKKQTWLKEFLMELKMNEVLGGNA